MKGFPAVATPAAATPRDDGATPLDLRTPRPFADEHLPGSVLSVEGLRDRMDEIAIVDVREGFEFRHSRIPGAISAPWMETWEKKEALPEDRTLAIVCGDEVRSAAAASILKRTGYQPALVIGGMIDWIEADYPIEKKSASGS